MIYITDLTLSYLNNSGLIPIFHEVDLSLEAGKVISLFGPNGCGKSTLLKFLAGYQTKDRIESNLVLEHIIQGKSVAFVPQHVTPSIMEWLAGSENIALPYVLEGESWMSGLQKTQDILQLLEGELPEHKLAESMSGGEKQITLLAREMARNADLLLLDEGFASIDFRKRFKLMSLIREWCHSTGRCILSVSHDIEETIYFSDIIYLIPPPPSSRFEEVRINMQLRDPQSIAQWAQDAIQGLIHFSSEALT